jgi:hypothetical protein
MVRSDSGVGLGLAANRSYAALKIPGLNWVKNEQSGHA